MRELPEALSEWKKIETERIILNWHISTHSRHDGLVIKLPFVEYKTYNNNIDDFLEKLSGSLNQTLENTINSLKSSLHGIRFFRSHEEDNEENNEENSVFVFEQWSRVARAESADIVADETIEKIKEELILAQEMLGTQPINLREKYELLLSLSVTFYGLAKKTLEVLEPSKRYVRTVLDRELAQANSSSLDAGELIFAATSYGAITDWAENEVLKRACNLAVDSISERGMIPSRRPFHSTKNGYHLNTIQFELFRGIAQLIQKVDISLPSEKIKKIIKFIEDNKVEGKLADKKTGWNFEEVPLPRKPSLWVTALAVLALDRIVRMLNEKINSAILEKRYFEVIKPATTKLTLNDLMYSDYGIFNQASKTSEHYKLPLPIILQLMSAHLTKTPIIEKNKYFSCILYGPPGTGKTTIAEALAKSCNANLVRLSPSDLIVQGQEAMETRAKAIFDALSLLSQTVIILDEFEPVISKRSYDPKQKDMPFVSFLKTGMLPKLKKLYEAAEEQNNIYFLATNYFSEIDSAAKRTGRFDIHIPVFNPDPLSRSGSILFKLIQHIKKNEVPKISSIKDVHLFRLVTLIKMTSDTSVQQLAIDWINLSKKYEISGAGYNYLIENKGEHKKFKSSNEDYYKPEGEEREIFEWLQNWEKGLSPGISEIRSQDFQFDNELLTKFLRIVSE